MAFFETRPALEEHSPYFARYVARVPAGDLREVLAAQGLATRRLLAPLDETRALFRYAPEKWSVKEVVGHVADAERIFAYRALRFARGDTTPLPAFDETTYVPVAGFDRRSLAALLDDLQAVRAATQSLLAGLDEIAWQRTGTASEHPVSVRALACIIAGHEAHHMAILRERYGV
jgi:hypothetical protein